MLNILVDTDILIDFARGHNDLLAKLFDAQANSQMALYTSPIIIAEFFAGKSLQDKSKHKKAEELFQNFYKLDIDYETSLQAGKILRQALSPTLGDAFIAATAITNNLRIATRNKKHFEKVKEIKFF